MLTPEQIDRAIKSVNGEFDGMSGNCARFAAILNRVIGGPGDYVLVDSGHYEYSDHVYLSYAGHLFDSCGVTTWQAVESENAVDDSDGDSDFPEDDEVTLETFSDPSEDGSDIRKAVDGSNPLAALWADEALEEALHDAFLAIGVQIPETARAPKGP